MGPLIPSKSEPGGGVRDPGRPAAAGTDRLAALLLGMTVVAYAAFVYRHALNIPFADDIADVLRVLSGLSEAENLERRLALLFEQHNDHRTLSSRLVYLAVYRLAGEIDFRVLVFLANLALPLLLCLLYLPLRRRAGSLLVMVPAALLLLQLRAYGITLWSMAAFAYFYVYLYGFASLYCLHRVNGGRLTLALLFATLSTFSLASGQLIWVVGTISLLQQCLLLRKAPLWYLPLWLLCAVAVLLVWRVGLQTPNDIGFLLGNFFDSPGVYLGYFLVLLGSAVSEQHLIAAALAGALLLSLLIGSSCRHYRQPDLRLELCAWFIALSVAAMVLGRAPYSELEYALSSRYSFPSVLMLATTWVMVARRWPGARLLLAVLLLSAIYCASSWHIYREALQPHVELRVERFNQGTYWQFGTPNRESNAVVAKAEALNIWQAPPRPHAPPKIAVSRRDG